MSRAFLSYSRKDKAFAERLMSSLSERSYDAWIDWEDIPPASRWMDEVKGAIQSADAFLFLISPDSVTSAVCGQEIAHAVTLHKRLVPLLVRETPATEVAPELASLNWLMFRPTDDFDGSVAKLIEALDTDLDWVREHTRLLVRAVEWEDHGKDESHLLRGADLDEAQGWLAGAGEGKRPAPAPLHYEYLRAGQAVQARELERMQTLYRNALARQLAAQAAKLQKESDALLDRSMLLAVESMRRLPNAEADGVLRDGLRLRAQQIAHWRQDGNPNLMAASGDGQWIAGCTADGVLAVRNSRNFLEPSQVQLEGPATALAFVPGRPILCVASGGTVSVFDNGEKRVLGSHGGPVGSLLALPDGKSIVSLGSRGATCWLLENGEARWRLPLDADCFSGAASSDSGMLAIGASDCVLRLIDAATGEVQLQCPHDRDRPVNVLERGASDSGVVATAFLEQGGLVCSAGLDGSVRWWDMASGECRYRGQHRRDVLCMAVHAARGLVASGSLDNTLKLWDATGRELARLPHQAGVTQVAWSIDGRWLLSACGDGCARLWDVAKNDQGLTEHDVTEVSRCVHGDWVEAALILAGSVPVSVSSKGEAIAWTIGAPDWRGRNHSYALYKATCSNDGDQVLVLLDAPTQILYDVKNGFSWRLLKHSTVQYAWITRDNAILTADWDGGVREFDLKTLELRCLQQHAKRVWNSALSRDQAWIATAVEGEKCVRVWRRGESQPRSELLQSAQVRSIDFSPDASLLVVACDDGSVRLCRVANGEELWFGAHKGIVWSIAFDGSGKYVASGGQDGQVVLRDAQTGAVLHDWPQEGDVSSLSFSPNGRWLAVALSHQGPFHVKIWDLQRGELAGRLAHEEHVHEMSWDREGSRLATASQDRRVRVFDVDSRRELVRLQFNGICGSARFVPNTQELLSTSYDGSLRLSIVDPNLLIERALERVPRRLTQAEWQQYLPDEPAPKA